MKLFRIGIMLAPLLAAACGDNSSSDDVGQATAALSVTPANAECIVITTTGTSTVTSQFTVSPGTSSTFDLSGLPLGSDTISANAYAVSCSNLTGAQATYTSASSISVTIVAGTPVMVNLQMVPAGSAGGGSVSVNFPTPHGVVTEYSTGYAVNPQAITTGPDGNVWFVTWGGDIVSAYTWGYQTVYTVPNPSPPPGLTSIAAGPDGYLWFTEYVNNKIGRISTTGTVAEFTVPTANSYPFAIAAGPDGNIWFTENSASKIGRLTPTTGAITEFTIPSANSAPGGIAVGSDGNLWFAEESFTSKIGRITPTGTFTEFALATGTYPSYLALGSDGNIWFTLAGVSKIGRITPGGVVTQFSTITANASPYGIAAGPDGNLWFTELSYGIIGRCTPTGAMSEYEIPTQNSGPSAIASGPDGNLWFIESSGDNLAKLAP